ncbi:DUF3021 family protein [Gudongella oleilytica]|jgi:hypothetical protein|uniref:DUF3021 family protein n=1 Tax=Gudongella oleilytica TaxID=1582259 RepID=UPI000ECC5C26|nr:DUF3021 family protein [Gudongella oleilytica]MDY0257421.1 DUF3021 family protein [Gudongella oleilytica]HCO18690.1 hypothetical protein [Tissierellales bacterium]
MDFRTFLIKKVLMSFLISVVFICTSIAVIGLIYEPEACFGYEAFFSPIIFGAAAALANLVNYSSVELTVRQAAFRSFLHLILLELIILSILYRYGSISSISMAISLGLSILIIYFTVSLVLWVNDNKTAKEFNQALRILQKESDNKVKGV